MITNETIVLEEKLEEMFLDLPDMRYGSSNRTYPVVFGYGDLKELNVFLKAKKSTTPYPLIWLLYPYEEEHSNTKLSVKGLTLLLAMKTDESLQNRQRIKETYTNVLTPLLNNIRYLFRRANTVNFNDKLTVTKYPNYSSSEDGDKHAGTFVWDATKVVLDFSVIDTCYRNVIFK